ncbi:MAG: fused MFS/spermidine synthase, partial [Deltaproteobacteria bacterium]|nr:fused MFS/spermidine synthase [Deltaproteobacteria bacterium]
MQRNAAYVAFFLSGASSLIFQNIWSRMLHHVFGATTIAMSSVVTLFMAGLGLGAFIAGRYADRIKHPIITYAFAELGVGLWAMLIPSMVNPEGWLADVNFTLRNSLGAESMGFMVARFLVVMPILLVPTTLMGTTLPLLARHFVQQEQRSGAAASNVGVLYAINTFGAVLGINLAGFILLPTVGLAYTNIVALSMNLVLGVGIFSFRGLLLGDMWERGTPLGWLPTKMKDLASVAAAEAAAEASAEEVQEKAKKKSKKSKSAKKAKKAEEAELASAGALETALPIPPIARKAAYLAFAASGAAALCYEVVWVRALSMTIGSSIYSFALILETFLIGIAGGSALCAAFMIRGRHRLTAAAIGAIALLALANVPWATGEDLLTYLLVTGVFAAPIAVMWGAVFAKARASKLTDEVDDNPIPGLVMLGIPVLAGLGNAAKFGGHISPILATVVGIVALYLAVMLVLRRYPVLLIAIIQLLIAISAFANYLFQDEIPLAFASLVTTVSDLPEHVGTVQFFMFVTAGLCTLPAAIGMGAMFPLTIRVWTSGGKNIGRDVGVVYAGNTVGSIIGAWLPGFVLMPLIGMERTLHVGMALNLLLALMMLIVSAAETDETAEKGKDEAEAGPDDETLPDRPPKKNAVPVWHAVTVYILAPLIPALAALLWLGTNGPDAMLRWNRSQMTLGVFRISLAADVLNPESWGEPDIVYYTDGLSTTVSVERWGRHYALKNNGKVDASNGDDMPTQIMVSAFPLLMHEAGPEDLDIAIIGFGSGVTVGSTLEFPVRSVDVIELERSVPEASQFFQDVNHLNYTLDDYPYVEADRLTVINDDGRNYLASTDRTYDIIMSEPSNPWITGVSDLFTTDHFRITKESLNPGGIYCQWVQL